MHEATSIVSNVLNTNCTLKLNGLSNGFFVSTLNDKTLAPLHLTDALIPEEILFAKAPKDSTVSKFKPMPTSIEAVETFERVVEKLKRCKLLLNPGPDATDSCCEHLDDSARKPDACLENELKNPTTASASCDVKLCQTCHHINYNDNSDCSRENCCPAGSSEKPPVVVSLYRLHLDDSDDDKDDAKNRITVVQYKDETQIEQIMRLITKDLSEPYSIYTYRYFIHNWPYLCFLAQCKEEYVGAIVCKLSLHGTGTRRGYIAMLAVDENFRRNKIGTRLVARAIDEMVRHGCDEVVLETEVTNKSAMQLYEKLGFVRDKRLFRYYLNGVDAFRLKLWLKSPDFLQYL